MVLLRDFLTAKARRRKGTQRPPRVTSRPCAFAVKKKSHTPLHKEIQNKQPESIILKSKPACHEKYHLYPAAPVL